MKPPYKSIGIILILLAGCCLSCKKFVQVPAPENQLVSSAVFTDSVNATSAVLGIYVNMMQSVGLAFSSGGMTLYPSLSSDELYPTGSRNDEKEFYTNSVLPTNSINAGLWTAAYNQIYATNACLEGLKNSKGITVAQKNQLTGEVKFLRGFLYFNLVNLYGGVPLVTTTNYHHNQALGRASSDEVYANIISDLSEAQALLSADYPSPNRMRPNLYTATSLLAKVYLFKKNWDLAEKSASQVISSGTYQLESDLSHVFLASSEEAIWKLSPVFPGVETWEGYYFVPTSTNVLPRYGITNSLLSAFEIGDQRKLNWLKANMIGGQQYFFPYKYKLGNDHLTVPKENYIVFRLSDQYLIRAEARAHQGNLNGALDDLNLIRNRAGLPDYARADPDSILAAIAHERQVELFCEWGNRWLDLKRTGKADEVLTSVKGANWQNTDSFYPIPQTELVKNSSLQQNSGY